jgi:tetratricopeptide (TPR) repeat protein
MANAELARKMRQLNDEVRGLDRFQELEFLNSRLETETDVAFAVQMKISKAKLLADMERTREAVALLEECSRLPDGTGSAAYLAAEILVESGEYQEAERFLEEAEQQSASGGNDYYKDCIMLLHAFCCVKLGELKRAQDLLETVADRDEELIWLRVRPTISVRGVEALITRWKASGGGR